MWEKVYTMSNIRERLQNIQNTIKMRECGTNVTLIAVSKTVNSEHITPVLEMGHRAFGENRVQEAGNKWPLLRERYEDIQLHLIGPLQSNKVAQAVSLFDAIQTIDRDKIAHLISQEMMKQNRTLQLFVQVNIGNEPQKAGIDSRETLAFVERCRNSYGLNIAGLMCIPPDGQDPIPYFKHLKTLSEECDVKHLSMGMSNDYETAIDYGATFVRVGSKLFGTRAFANETKWSG
jgi:PLP dependent protein